jgi:hypothetical protein
LVDIVSGQGLIGGPCIGKAEDFKGWFGAVQQKGNEIFGIDKE